MPLSLWRRRYGSLIRSAWLGDLQYRAGIVVWVLGGALEPMIALGIWWSIAADGPVSGYGRAEFAQYFFAVMLVNQLTVAWEGWYVSDWIRSGELNHRLVRPLNPIHESLAGNVAYKIRAAVLLVTAWFLVALIWPVAELRVGLAQGLLAAATIVPAAAICFLSSYTTGLLAFWITRATAFLKLHSALSLFLAGRIAPIAFLPGDIDTIARFTWFPYILSFPVEVLTGRVVTMREYVGGIAMQLVWLAAWWMAYKVVWSFGLRRHAAVGG